jgi:hypothetical protein
MASWWDIDGRSYLYIIYKTQRVWNAAIKIERVFQIKYEQGSNRTESVY